MNFKTFLQKVVISTRWRLFDPKTPTVERFEDELIHLGSKYGGKTVVTSLLDSDSIVISAGAGEDISFELEVESRTKCFIYILDPTPSAITHLEQILSQGNKRSTLKYSLGPRQEVGTYNTSKTNFSKNHCISKALWKSKTELKSYPPISDERDGSYSLSSSQKNYQKNKHHIIVVNTSIPLLLEEKSILKVDLLKLDIEGAASKLLTETFAKKYIQPKVRNF